MHRVVKSHVQAFRDEFALKLDESKLFEAFCAYCIAKQFTFENVNPDLLTYEGADPGIDSAFYAINDQIITTLSEAEKIFSSRKTDNDVRLVFVQSKTSEGWQKHELDVFSAAVQDFISERPNHAYSDYLEEQREIFNLVINNVGKVKSGRPYIDCYYVTSGPKLAATEIISAKNALEDRLRDAGLFDDCRVVALDRDELIKYWVASRGAYKAQFRVIGSASFPKSAGIEESYAVTVSARDFVQAVLEDDRGSLRRSIFDENVRDFISFDDSEINSEIISSLTSPSSSSRFGILNNGITIISPEVRLQSNEMHIEDYQIVNGCQTSNVLYEARREIPQDATLMVKIIETRDQAIVDEIVRSTNRKNKIEDHQFLATMDSVKSIEKYFNVRSEDDERRLFFERRPHQYSKDNIPTIRVFDIKEIARCCGAMFFDRPDLSSRYPNQLVEDLREVVFSSNNKEEIFYTSSFAHYRLKLHLSNNRIDPIFNQLRWYALMGVKYYICGANAADVRSSKIEKQCEKINDFFTANDPVALTHWDKIAGAFKSLGPFDRDRIKASRFVQEVREAALSVRGS